MSSKRKSTPRARSNVLKNLTENQTRRFACPEPQGYHYTARRTATPRYLTRQQWQHVEVFAGWAVAASLSSTASPVPLLAAADLVAPITLNKM